jgi:ornithine decarboxylase
MTARAWHQAIDDLARTLVALKRRGIFLEHINLGGGLPALGYLDRRGQPLEPRLDEIFAAIREGMQRLRSVAGRQLAFVIEPGRHLVADHGVIRAQVVRLTTRTQRSGEREYWLYLSCGKFNGLNETDELHYRLQFPNDPGGEYVSAFVAGPTCDGSDVFDRGHLVRVPIGAASGDPVWILSSGAYSVSYMTRGFNGFDPLPHRTVSGEPAGAGVESAGLQR